MLFPERPITVEHIRAFCAKFDEAYRIEYKSTFDTNVRDKIPKVVSSFANSHGGVLVVGVDTLNGVHWSSIPHATTLQARRP
jgi:predicted HTH transcriptional regulator